jgi:hypothetical protein
MKNKLFSKVKDLFEAATDGSKGSLVDVIKITIKICKEFVMAVKARLNQSVKKLDEKSE